MGNYQDAASHTASRLTDARRMALDLAAERARARGYIANDVLYAASLYEAFLAVTPDLALRAAMIRAAFQVEPGDPESDVAAAGRFLAYVEGGGP